MCDRPHFEDLEGRVDDLEKQVAVLNSTHNQITQFEKLSGL